MLYIETYNQESIERLKNFLISNANSNHTVPYEIFVDALKVVPKTDRYRDFEKYEDFITADTRQIKFLIYNTPNSPRNDKYIFSLKAQTHQEAVNEFMQENTRSYSKSSLALLREKQELTMRENSEIQRLNEEVADLTAELDEKVEYIYQLEDLVQQARANGNKLGELDLGEALSNAFEGLIRRNTHIIKKVPMIGDGLAGLIESDNKQQELQAKQASETPATFSESGSHESTLNEQEKEFVRLFTLLQKHFNELEFNQVIAILDLFSKDKKSLAKVIEILNSNSTN